MNEDCQKGSHCLIADWVNGKYVYRCIHCGATKE